MKFYEFEVSIDELEEVVGLIDNLRNKKRNYICLLLHLSTKILLEWYNEINKIFTPVLIKRGIKNLSDDKKNSLYVFSQQEVYSPVIDELLIRLDKINKNKNEYVDALNNDQFTKIENIHDRIRSFYYRTRRDKREWITEICKTNDWDLNAITVK